MNQFNDFHLWEHLEFQAWWILSSFTMDEQEINDRKSRVERILDKYSGITLENYSFDLNSIPTHKFERIKKLLQENSILQDALVYAWNESAEQWNSIWDILSTARDLIFSLDKHNLATIYNFADFKLRGIVSDIDSAILKWFFIPTEQDIQDLNSLRKLIDRTVDKLNSPGWIMNIWAR